VTDHECSFWRTPGEIDRFGIFDEEAH